MKRACKLKRRREPSPQARESFLAMRYGLEVAFTSGNDSNISAFLEAGERFVNRAGGRCRRAVA
jgi:hypothetical protein